MEAILNEKGLQLWGYAFPDGRVPVTCPVPSQVEAADSNGPLQEGTRFNVYFVDWSKLTILQKQKVLAYFKERFGGSPDAVLAEIQKHGLPLRASLVACVSIPANLLDPTVSTGAGTRAFLFNEQGKRAVS